MQSAELVRERLDCDLSPGDALRALRDDHRPFALTGDWATGGATLGSDPLTNTFLTVFDDQLSVSGEVPAGAVGGGWFGWLSYGVGALVERLPPPPPRPVPGPISSWAFYDNVLRLDPGGRWWFEALVTEPRREELAQRAEDLRARLAKPPEARPYEAGPFTPRPGAAGYRRAVETCLGYIAAGDLYQANLALRLEAEWSGSALDAFADAIAALEPTRAAFIGEPGHEIVSLSPELFLSRHDREVLTAPIKGTRPRSEDPAAAKVAADELRESAKDAAENVMIVDLMRNDLGRVCDYGSVRAELATEPEAHPGVWHMVARVWGDLTPGVTDPALLQATFPPGSVTGAPKIKAQEVISELECTGREAYTGGIGFASPLAGLELNVAIRTFEVSGERVWLGVGAGIVADSDPAAEYEETIAKGAPLVAAIGSRIEEAPEPSHRLGPLPIRLPRPDPAQGLVETLMTWDGEPCELEEHLARLAGSARALYRAELDTAELGDLVRASAPAEGRARARILLAATLDEAPSVIVTPVDPPAGGPPTKLLPATIPGGLGSHKWADRALVNALAPEPGTEALICDIDGAVLETGAGNIWALHGETLLTPPLDGRALAGVTREVLFAVTAEEGVDAREQELGLDDLEAADELLITSSIRGVHGAQLAGSEPPSRSGYATTLAELLSAHRRVGTRR